MERLWVAAHCFHKEGSEDAGRFGEDRLRSLLKGDVGRVIGGLRQRLTKHHLSVSRRKTLESVITYLENNRRHIAYDQYLKAGYPIGSGTAEGACLHLVKDRMEQTEMRWTVSGAQAMLHLRATYLNGQCDEFVEYRIRREQNRLYAQTVAQRPAGYTLIIRARDSRSQSDVKSSRRRTHGRQIPGRTSPCGGHGGAG